VSPRTTLKLGAVLRSFRRPISIGPVNYFPVWTSGIKDALAIVWNRMICPDLLQVLVASGTSTFASMRVGDQLTTCICPPLQRDREVVPTYLSFL